MRSFGPDDRDLLRSDAARLYEEIVAEGGIKEGDPRIAADADERPAFDLLLGLGLVTPDRVAGVFQAVDPGAVQSRARDSRAPFRSAPRYPAARRRRAGCF